MQRNYEMKEDKIWIGQLCTENGHFSKKENIETLHSYENKQKWLLS